MGLAGAFDPMQDEQPPLLDPLDPLAPLPADPLDTSPDLEPDLQEEPPEPEEEDDSRKPWYLRKAEDVVAALDEKRDDYFNAVSQAGLVRMWRVAWAQYYGTDPDNPGEMATQQTKRVGQEKEYTRVRINEPRSFIKQAIQTAIGVRPAFKATTESSDFATLAGIEAVDRAIAYVMKTAFPNRKRRRFLERAMVLGFSFAHVRWDAEGGDDTKEEVTAKGPDGQPIVGPYTGEPITDEVDVKSGAPVIGIGCGWDTYFDFEEEDGLSWQVGREKRAKGELAALFPEFADDILDMGDEDRFSRERLFNNNSFIPTSTTDSDKLVVEHFYLARCAGAENGRYIMFLPDGEGGKVLLDRELPIKAKGKIPIVNLVPSAYIGAFLGYADSWDMLSLQQLADNVVSDWASNVRALGRANLMVQKGAGINYDAMRQGLRVIEQNPGTEQAYYLLPPKIENASELLQFIGRSRESITQQNAVRRGDPQANIKSGTMAALFNQQSIEFLSDVQEEFDGAETEIANISMEMIRSRSKGKFMVQVAGEGQRPYWEAFSKEGLKGIKSVEVESVSPAMRSPSGRYETYNVLKNEPDKAARGAVLRGLNTGDWSGYAEVDKSTDLRIVKENELLLQGLEVQVGIADDHEAHAASHWALFERLEAVDPSPPPQMMSPEGMPIGQPPPPGKYEKAKAAILAHLDKHSADFLNSNPAMNILLKRLMPPPVPGTPTWQMMMATQGMGATPTDPAAGQGAGGDSAPPTDDGTATPAGEQPKQPKPAEPAQPPKGEAA